MLDREPAAGSAGLRDKRCRARHDDARICQRDAGRAEADGFQERRSPPVGRPLRRPVPLRPARPSERGAPGRHHRGHGLRRTHPDGAPAVSEHSGEPTPASSSRPTPRKSTAASTRDDVHTLLQLVYLKLTAPRLDPARLDSKRAALKGYLASMSNSPQRQFEDFTHGRAVAGPSTGAASAEAWRPGPGECGTLGRDVSRAVRQRGRHDVRAGRQFLDPGNEAPGGSLPGRTSIVAAKGAFPRRRRAISVRRHRPHAAEGV